MAADTKSPLMGVATSESTRTLLRVVILSLIAGAAIASRLFSVIRKLRWMSWCHIDNVDAKHLYPVSLKTQLANND